MTPELANPADRRTTHCAPSPCCASFRGCSIINSDCMAVMSKLADRSYDLAICDPPYGIGWSQEFQVMSAGIRKDGTQRKMEEWNNPRPKQYASKKWDDAAPGREYFDELRRVSKKQIIWGGNYFTEHLPPSGGWVSWEKGVPDGMSLSQCELAWTNCLNSVRHVRLLWAGYKKCEETSRVHPTQKPVKLYSWLLENYAKCGQRILDTHAGSGSSVIAALDRGFEMLACEIDPEYYATAVERIGRHEQQGMLAMTHNVRISHAEKHL